MVGQKSRQEFFGNIWPPYIQIEVLSIRRTSHLDSYKSSVKKKITDDSPGYCPLCVISITPDHAGVRFLSGQVTSKRKSKHDYLSMFFINFRSSDVIVIAELLLCL